ncbi:MAG: Si-specific NAD(P)(+) transhydrogenase [Mariprofundaceae bacterium]|nr:Si-specific NAD(P)(+) transhydrogenase [Mariprofundaceae bacterium]
MADFDLFVIGSGPAGQHAALRAAQMGKRVGMVERKERIGGAGLQTGTIPSKALREVSYMASRLGRRGMRGVLSPNPQQHGVLSEALHRKDMVIAQQESVILTQLMRSGVSLIPGNASFVDEHTLKIGKDNHESKLRTADVIILATGSRPRRPSDVPFDKLTVLDSTSILKIQHLPKSMLVVGGGVIACEFISMFAALGVQVQVVDSHSQILSYLSKDVVDVLTHEMDCMGVSFRMNSRCASIQKEEGSICTTLESGEKMYSDVLLYAQGREPNFQSLQIEHAGVEATKGWIDVNAHFQTSVSHIYAVGDLIGRPSLASTGMEQGRMAAQHAFGTASSAMNSNMPMAIYTIPELSSVGKTEKQLQEEGADYVVGRGWFKESARGQIIGDATGLLKLNVLRQTKEIMGVHIAGESASELIHIGQLVMNLHGTVEDLVHNVFNYPTLAECYKLAATDCLNQLR